MRGIYQPVAIQTNLRERGQSPAPGGRISDRYRAEIDLSDAASIERAIVLFSLEQVACATTLKIRTEAPPSLSPDSRSLGAISREREEGTLSSLLPLHVLPPPLGRGESQLLTLD